MIISWGKPTIKYVAYTNGTIGSGAKQFPTPADGTTQLTSEKGDKMEALIEGGEPEAVKYKRGKYSLEFQVRLGQGRIGNDGKVKETLTNDTGTGLIEGEDGKVDGEWTVQLVAEDTGAPGFTMPRAVCSYTDNYSAADGIIRTYTFDSLKPTTGNQIKWDAAS